MSAGTTTHPGVTHNSLSIPPTHQRHSTHTRVTHLCDSLTSTAIAPPFTLAPTHPTSPTSVTPHTPGVTHRWHPPAPRRSRPPRQRWSKRHAPRHAPNAASLGPLFLR